MMKKIEIDDINDAIDEELLQKYFEVRDKYGEVLPRNKAHRKIDFLIQSGELEKAKEYSKLFFDINGLYYRMPPSPPYFVGWCVCSNDDKTIFKDNDDCSCGVGIHHNHCMNCGKITQVG